VAETILRLAFTFVPMILALSVHEFAHAWSAKKLGDPTAEGLGRLTLNPLAHADPFGTLLVPLMGVLSGFGYFGWAKPVPVNPVRFTRKISMRTGMMLVAAAGPISNVLQAIIGTALLALGLRAALLPDALNVLLYSYIKINIVLALFNMIPVGPLDGQKVVAGFLQGQAAADFDRFNAQYGVLGLIAVILGASYIIGPALHAILNTLLAVFGLR
jgi:Zn-dependent protease